LVTALFAVLTEPTSRAERTRFVRAAVSPPLESQLGEHRSVLLGVALKLTHNEALANDLVQDTFLRAIERQSSFVAGTALRSWLITILHHRFIDLCRREKARGVVRSIDDGELDIAAPEPEAPRAWTQLGVDSVRAAAEKLPDEMREAYRMHAFEGMAYAEISKRLGITQSTVGTRLLRARRKIKQILEDGAR
jgi:RNA polymerase sigma-70 factor, ECF subfamily